MSTKILTTKDVIVIIDVIIIKQKANFLKLIRKLGRSTDEINTNKATDESKSNNTMSENREKKSSWMMHILNMMMRVT